MNAYGYYTDGQGQQKKLYLKDALTELESKEISSYVRSYKVKGIDGSYSAISLKPGVKYTFVAHTYDAGSSLYNIQKKPVFTVNKEIKVTDAQKNQTYKNIQIILVNDGSTDNSPALCDEYKQMYDKVEVIHKSNGGLPDARNAGLKRAKGEYVGFIDSDDWIEPNMVEHLLHNIIEVRCGY